MSVAIIVGTYNRLEQLQALIASIRVHVATPFLLYVSDAGSSDGTVQWLANEAKIDPRVRPIFELKKVGQAAALNAVFAGLDTDYACWVSDDNVFVGNGLDLAVRALADDPRLGMVGLKVRDVRGPFKLAPYIGGVTSVGVININQGVLPTSLLKSLGGFNEQFSDYGIDADLTTRVLLAGYDVALTRSVAIEHYRNWPDTGTTEARLLEQRNEAYRRRYKELYGTRLRSNLAWLAKRSIWKMVRNLSLGRLDLDHPRPILGTIVRDWHNMITGRFVSIGSELRDMNTAVYLRQRLPPVLVASHRPQQGPCTLA